MKKIALMLAIALVLSVSMCVFASAEGTISGELVVTYGLDADGNVNISDSTFNESNTGYDLAIPSDVIAVQYNFDTNNTGFAAYIFELNYDPTKLQLLGCINTETMALAATGDMNVLVFDKTNISETFGGVGIFGEATPDLPWTAVADNAIKEGDEKGPLRIVGVNGVTNYKKGLKNLTSGVAGYIYFQPITDEACDTTISIPYMEATGADKVKHTGSGNSITIKLNGGAPEAAAPVVSLGAKVNAALTGLRFGATYNKIEENGIVNDLGMLLLPTAKLGENTLDLDFAAANALVAKVRARSIEGYVEGYNFEDYTTFNFYVTLLGLEGHEDADIVAVPYIVYDDGTVIYADQMVHSFNSASEAAA
ncbi:MAG: hypothetical protein IJO64_07810 [Clostridia bacterium]|nr:hypothetical protein [Clostridia bacterium]